MLFALGFIAGLIVATLIVATLAVFRKAIDKPLLIMERALGQMGPQPRGFVFEPQSEANEKRSEIIERNRRIGRDTPIEELRDA